MQASEKPPQATSNHREWATPMTMPTTGHFHFARNRTFSRCVYMYARRVDSPSPSDLISLGMGMQKYRGEGTQPGVVPESRGPSPAVWMRTSFRIAVYILLFAVGIIFIILLIPAVSTCRLYLRGITLTKLEGPAQSFRVADLDKNGKEEIIRISMFETFPHTPTISCLSPFSSLAYSKFTFITDEILPFGGELVHDEDLRGDGDIPIMVLTRGKDGFILKTLDKAANTFREGRFPIYHFPPINTIGLPGIEIADLEGDGEKELIVMFATAWGSPRGVIAYDLTSGRRLWEYQCGCLPTRLRLCDINRDGAKEVIFSGRGAHNNVSVGGTDDEHSYLIVLSHEGREIWKRSLGWYYTSVLFDIGDPDRDGRLEIVTSKLCHRESRREPGEVRTFDAMTGTPEKALSEPDTSFYDICVRDIAGTEGAILVGDSRGRVCVLSPDLKILKSTSLTPPALVYEVCGLGANPKSPYIFVQSGYTRFVILDTQLKRVMEFQFGEWLGNLESTALRPIINGTEKAVVLNTDNLYLIRKKAITLLSTLSALVGSRLLLYLALLILNGIMVVLWARYKSPAVVETAAGWAELVQEVVHRMKTPLFTIQLEAERELSALSKKTLAGENPAVSPQSILDDVNDLNQKIRTIMRLLKSRTLALSETDINELIRDLAALCAGPWKDKIEFEVDLDPDSTRTMVDSALITEALMNLVENAAEAMPEGGKIRIASTVRYSPILRSRKGIEIEVGDNGQGIPEETIRKIFEPYFTTKKNGVGLGLSIAKRIVEAHGGRIQVQSRAGVGTRFAIYIPSKR